MIEAASQPSQRHFFVVMTLFKHLPIGAIAHPLWLGWVNSV
jgi:hypothetical protein